MVRFRSDLEDDDEPTPTDMPQQPQPRQAVEREPDTSEVVSAELRENTLYQGYKWAMRTGVDFNAAAIDYDRPVIGWNDLPSPNEIDPDFDKELALKSQDIPQEDWNYFEHVRNPSQFKTVLEFYHQDKEDEEILHNASFAQTLGASLLTMPLDPLTHGVGRAVQALKYGTPLVRSALAGGIWGASSYSIRATATDSFKKEDLAVETIAGAVAAGLFHGGIYGGTKLAEKASPIFKRIKSGIADAIDPRIDHYFDMNKEGVLEKVADKEWVQQAKRKIWQAANNTLFQQFNNSGDPIISDAGWKIMGERNLSWSKGGETLLQEMTVVEKLKLWDEEIFKLSESNKKLQDEFVKRGGTVEDFNKSVAHYMVTGIKSGNPKIDDCAANLMDFSKKIIDEARKAEARSLNEWVSSKSETVLTKELAEMSDEEFNSFLKRVELGLDTLPENKTAEFHLFREYEEKNITDEFIGKLRRSVLLNRPDLADKPEELESIVNRLLTGIKGWKVQVPDFGIGGDTSKAGRNVAMFDDVLLQSGVLKFDPVINYLGHFKKLLVDTELNNAARSLNVKVGDKAVEFVGWRAPEGASKAEEEKYFVNWYARNANKILGPNEKKIGEATSEAYKYNLQLLTDTESLLKGNFGKSDVLENHKVLKWVNNNGRTAAYVSMAGQIVTSMIPDMALVGTRKGMWHAFKRLMPVIFPKEKLEKHDAKTLRKFFDWNEDLRMRMMDMYPAEFRKGSDWMEKAARLTNKVQGLDLFTRYTKSKVSEDLYSELIDACLNKNDPEYLKQMGITAGMRDTIAEVFNKYGNTTRKIKYVDPIFFDSKLQNQIKASIRSRTDSILASPGYGNLPRYLRTEIGSMVYMFHSYPYMIYQSFYRPIMAGHIPLGRAASVIAASLALSATNHRIRDFLNGKETDWTSPETCKSIIEYSNLDIPLIDAAFEIQNVVQRRSLTHISPVLTWLDNVIGVISNFINGKIATRQLRNMTFPLNLWYLRPLTNDLFPYANRRRR